MVFPRADVAGGGILARRRALVAACVGNAVEWYDFAIYAAFATILVPLFFPVDTVLLLPAFALYGTAFLVRPAGAVIFGRRGDAHGRRQVLVLVLGLMTGATVLVGVLPEYAMIGIAASFALVGLRLAQGLAAGGELGVAAVFLIEHSPPHRRGLYGAWQPATMALGLALGLLVAGLLARLPGDLSEGTWRVAFLVALPLGFVGVYLRLRVPETPPFVRLQESQSLAQGPIRTLWEHHRGGLRTGFATIAAGSLAFNTFFVFLPNHLALTTSVTLSAALLSSVVGLAALAAAAVLLGALSDLVGRRPVVLGSLCAVALCALPLNALAHSGSLLALVLAQVGAGIAVAGALPVAMITEMFPAELRTTALGLTAGLSTALVGGTAPFVDQLLFLATGTDTAPALYVAAVGCLAVLAVRGRSETAFSSLD